MQQRPLIFKKEKGALLRALIRIHILILAFLSVLYAKSWIGKKGAQEVKTAPRQAPRQATRKTKILFSPTNFSPAKSDKTAKPPGADTSDF